MTHPLSITLSSILTIADNDPKQSNYLSSLDIITTLQTISHHLSSHTLPQNLFTTTEHTSYLLKECKDIVISQLPHIPHAFSVAKLLFARVITPIVQSQINSIDELIDDSLDIELTLNESYSNLIRKDV